MENEKLKASCPVCGRNLFRGSKNSYLEGPCPKCGRFLKISFTEDGINISTLDVKERHTINI